MIPFQLFIKTKMIRKDLPMILLSHTDGDLHKPGDAPVAEAFFRQSSIVNRQS